MKQFLLLCALMFTSPLFASGIDANAMSAPCDNTTLETYGGTANVEINWEPNTINLRWYDRGEQLSVQNAAQTCVYDGSLAVPNTTLTRTGYTFVGWELDRSCGLKHVDTSINGTGRCHRNPDGSKHCYDGANYDLTENGTWAVVFDYGTIFGEALCSVTSGGDGKIGVQDTNNTGDYCWCRITGFVWPEGGICSTTSAWMSEKLYSGGICSTSCAGTCAYRFYAYDYLRTPLYNSLPE